MCNNEEICKILEENIAKVQGVALTPQIKETTEYKPPKIPIMIGWLYKTGPLIFNIKRRFFVLDPYDGTFIRFKSNQHYPLKPR